MKLPWGEDEEKKRRIEELEEKIEELEEEKEKFKNKYEAEEERRSELADEKQRAERRLNVIEQRLNTLQEKQKKEEKEEEKVEFEELDFQKAYRTVKKLDSVKSSEDDLVTIYSPTKLSKINDFKGLKNAITRDQLEKLQRHESFIGLVDQDIFHEVLKTRPFFKSNWEVDEEFDMAALLEFIETEKTWVLVSAGETEIYEERAGDVQKVNVVKSRVDKQHSKGGFSQGRFERKREEQIDEHLGQVREEIKNERAVYLLGERSLCKKLPGSYLGGFDDNNALPDELYKFRLTN